MVIRQFIAFTAMFATSVLIARALTPADVGMLTIAMLTIRIGSVVVDAGLSASLVRQSEPVTPEQVGAIFSAQMLVLAGYLTCAGFIGVGLHVQGPPWFSLSAFAICAASVVVIPVSSLVVGRLERDLRFGVMGALTLIQPLGFSIGAALVLHFSGGVVGISWGLLLSYLMFLPAAAAMGMFPRPGSIRGHLEGRLRFGLPLMGSSLISQFKDSVNPIFIPWVLGAASVGYINWAQQLAVVATYVVAVLAKAFFPAFARLSSREELNSAVATSVFWANAFVAPVTCMILVNAVPITLVVYGEQWLPAADLLRLLLVANLLAPTAAMIMTALNAHGRTGLTFAYTVLWALMTWALVPVLVGVVELEGYGVANCIVTASTLGLLWHGRNVLPLRLLPGALVAWPVAAVSVFGGHFVQTRLLTDGPSVASLAVSGTLSTLLFLPLLALASRKEFVRLRKALSPG